MENFKKLKPHFSQACDRLFARVSELLEDECISQTENENETYDYWT